MMHPQQPMTPAVMPDKVKLGYAIGFNIANNAKKGGWDVDVDTIATAMKDVFAGRPTQMNENEVKEILTQFNGALRAKMMAEREKEISKNKIEGEEFLAKNAKAPGVITLPNGLQYKVLKEGTGDMPKPTDSVVVAYKGSLVDGTVFDQSEHFATKVTGRTIKGWSEILPLMKTGSKWEVAIPTDLAYGARGFAPKIGPNCALVFDMELLSIGAPAPPPPVTNRPALSPSALAPHPGPPAPPGNSTSVTSDQIIMVPSADDLKKGAKIQVITNAPKIQ